MVNQEKIKPRALPGRKLRRMNCALCSWNIKIITILKVNCFYHTCLYSFHVHNLEDMKNLDEFGFFKDLVSWILANLIRDDRTRRSLMKKLKEMCLIANSKVSLPRIPLLYLCSEY